MFLVLSRNHYYNTGLNSQVLELGVFELLTKLICEKRVFYLIHIILL